MKKIIFFLLSVLGGEIAAFDCLLVPSLDNSVEDQYRFTVNREIGIPCRANKIFRGQNFRIYVFIKNQTGNIVPEITLRVGLANGFFRRLAAQIYPLNATSENWQLAAMAQTRFIDAAGIYKLTAEVRQGKETKTITESITLSAYSIPNAAVNDAAARKLFAYYYRDPDPEKLLPAYVFFCGKDYLCNNPNAFSPLMAFFISAFSDNAFLIPFLIKEYPNQTERTKKYFNYLFLQLQGVYDFNEFYKSLTPEEMAFVEQQRRDEKKIFVFAGISHPYQLDIEWSRFLATGRFQYILAAAKTMEVDSIPWSKFKEFFKRGQAVSKEEKVVYFRGLTAAVAETALESACRDHPLVKRYCRYIMRYGDLNESGREKLRIILEKAELPVIAGENIQSGQ